MFCRNCANQLDEQAAVCISCGAPKGTGTAYCSNCATPTNPGAAICTNCGMSLTAIPSNEQKSKMTAGLLGIFLGGFGVHNFYLGYTNRAILQIVLTICTCSLAAWWGIIEGIMILTGKTNTDAQGNPLVD